MWSYIRFLYSSIFGLFSVSYDVHIGTKIDILTLNSIIKSTYTETLDSELKAMLYSEKFEDHIEGLKDDKVESLIQAYESVGISLVLALKNNNTTGLQNDIKTIHNKM